MPYYSSDSELYGDLGACLRDVLCDPANADRARAVGSVIRIETVRPKAQLTLNLATDVEPEVAFGETALRPGAVITIDADALRDFFLGEASLIAALSGGKMKAQGPVAPILRVVPLANLVAPAFRERDGSPGVEAAAEGEAAPGGDAEAKDGEDGGWADDEDGAEEAPEAGDAGGAEEEPGAGDAGEAEEEPAEAEEAQS